MQTVVIADVKKRSFPEGIDEVFAAFGGIKNVIPANQTVSIKPNAVSFNKRTYTDPAVLEALLAYLRDHGYAKLELMENVTAGNFTRLVFDAIGYLKLCRRYGAKPIFLDEGPGVEVKLRGEDVTCRIPKWLAERFVDDRQDRFYLSLPKLKTHSMSKVTLGVKNQQAFPVHADRMHRHNHETLHHRLAALYDWLRPDFCLVDGVHALRNGHFPAAALLSECVVPMNLLIGGRDTLAVDVVAAKILGYRIDEVEHLRLCRLWGLGEGDLGNIEIRGVPLARFKETLPYTLLGRYHPEVQILEGSEKACGEGCKGNSLCILEMLTNDYGGKGGWTLVLGKGHDLAALEKSQGPLLVVGPCAVEELRPWLTERFAERTMYFINACNDLMTNTTYQARLSGVQPIRMTPINPVRAAWLLLLSKLHRSTARIPPLLG